MSYSTGSQVNLIHCSKLFEARRGHEWLFFHLGHLRLCYINVMAQFHTLHKHLIHYHIPFN